jgi:hypothetical protein
MGAIQWAWRRQVYYFATGRNTHGFGHLVLLRRRILDNYRSLPVDVWALKVEVVVSCCVGVVTLLKV